MTAIGYIRVSTQDQVDTGLSLEAQEKAIHAYSEAKGLGEVEILRDNGKSAKSLRGRPGMAVLVARVAAGGVAHVIVHKIDRMFRSIRDALEVFEKFKKKGASFHSITESWDTSTAIGEAMLQLVLVFAELERKQTGERTATVLRNTKQSLGGTSILDYRKRESILVVGQAPYGFRWKDKTLVEIPEEMLVAREIVTLRVDKFLSYKAIAARMNDEGYTTRSLGLWYAESVKRIVHRDYYR